VLRREKFIQPKSIGQQLWELAEAHHQTLKAPEKFNEVLQGDLPPTLLIWKEVPYGLFDGSI
jgi:hypothetical protein